MGWLYSAGNPDEDKIAELAELGYWDDAQNRAALSQSNGNLKMAVALIAQGKVPDIEQGYVSPTVAKGAPSPESDFWRREFTVTKLTWGNINLNQQQEESKGHLRFCCYRDGLQAWTSMGGCVWRSDWKQISSFGLGEDKTTFVLHSARKSQVGDLKVKSGDGEKIMAAVMEIASKLATELKAETAAKAARKISG